MTNFNYTLTDPFWNSTGNGTLCVPSLALPVGLTVVDGTQASIQVVTMGEKGSALYNCADITFRSAAKALEGNECVTSEGITVAPIIVGNGSNTEDGKGGNGAGTSQNTTTDGGKGGQSAAPGMRLDRTALGSVVGLAVAFVFALSI